ncbi:hypothetical protein HK102_001789 [Quaeritorhiza haematococci]|nr:hypothetical protein HK102_001789 [Quaeritorhiza haematococci]
MSEQQQHSHQQEEQVPQSHAIPVQANTHEARSERSFKSKAHDPTISHEARVHAAEKFSELHEKRTGEHIDPKDEYSIGDKKAQLRGTDYQ